MSYQPSPYYQPKQPQYPAYPQSPQYPPPTPNTGYQPYPPGRPMYHYPLDNPFAPPVPIASGRKMSNRALGTFIMTVICTVLAALSVLTSLLGILFGDVFSLFMFSFGIVVMMLGVRSLIALARVSEGRKEAAVTSGVAATFFFLAFVVRDVTAIASIEGTGSIADQARAEGLAAMIIDIIFMALALATAILALLLEGRLMQVSSDAVDEDGSSENVIVEESLR